VAETLLGFRFGNDAGHLQSGRQNRDATDDDVRYDLQLDHIPDMGRGRRDRVVELYANGRVVREGEGSRTGVHRRGDLAPALIVVRAFARGRLRGRRWQPVPGWSFNKNRFVRGTKPASPEAVRTL